MSKKEDLRWPSKRIVESLMKELREAAGCSWRTPEEEMAIDQRLDMMIESFKKSAAYSKLSNKLEAMRKKREARKERMSSLLRKCRQNYYTMGPTPKVVAALQRLVDDVNGGRL